MPMLKSMSVTTIQHRSPWMATGDVKVMAAGGLGKALSSYVGVPRRCRSYGRGPALASSRTSTLGPSTPMQPASLFVPTFLRAHDPLRTSGPWCSALPGSRPVHAHMRTQRLPVDMVRRLVPPDDVAIAIRIRGADRGPFHVIQRRTGPCETPPQSLIASILFSLCGLDLDALVGYYLVRSLDAFLEHFLRADPSYIDTLPSVHCLTLQPWTLPQHHHGRQRLRQPAARADDDAAEKGRQCN